MMSIETSRFEEEHDYETRYNFKFFFFRILKNLNPGKLHCSFFQQRS